MIGQRDAGESMKIARISFKTGRGYTEAEWSEADIPPLTDEELAQARPFADVFPELAARMRRNPTHPDASRRLAGASQGPRPSFGLPQGGG